MGQFHEGLPARLDAIEQRYEEACMHMGLANWNHYSKEGLADLDGAREEFARLFLDREARRQVEEAWEKSEAGLDPRSRRRLEMWRRCFIGGRIEGDRQIAPLENALERRLTHFEFTVGGEKASRAQILLKLQQDSDSERRRRAWSAAAQLHRAMEEDFRRLVALRNTRAREAGFAHFYQLSLYLQGLDETWLLSTLQAVEEKTREPHRRFLEKSRGRLKLASLRPWDLRRAVKELVALPDLRFPKEKAFPVLKGFHRQIGFPVTSLPIREVVLDIPFGGLSLAIHIPTDARFLVNPTQGHQFYSTAFHEYGHALAAVYNRVEEPILKGYEWIPGAQSPAYAEGLAEVHADFSRSPLWLRRYSPASEAETERYRKSAPLAAVMRLRNLLASFFFEYNLYCDPEQDLDRLEREVTERYLLVERGEGEPPHWAGDTWYTTYPCYYQNYILAAMISSQVHQALAAHFGGSMVDNAGVAPWLIETLYSAGESVAWEERIRGATGLGLDPAAYLARLTSA